MMLDARQNWSHHEDASLSDGRHRRILYYLIRAVETAKPVGQAPLSFYLAQDTATLKCQIVEIRPVAGSRMKAIGTAHSTRAAAETALNADKTCANPFEVSKNERIRL
jgi:hypothetical protein